MDRPRVVGLAWYTRESWEAVTGIMVDRDRLPDSYPEWLISAEQVEAEVARSGLRVVRVVLEPEAFSAWCAAHGRRRDGKARSECVAAFVQAQNSGIEIA